MAVRIISPAATVNKCEAADTSAHLSRAHCVRCVLLLQPQAEWGAANYVTRSCETASCEGQSCLLGSILSHTVFKLRAMSCCSGYRKVAALATAYKPEAAVEGTADAQPAAAQSLRRSVFQEALRSMAASEGASAEDVEVRRVCPEKCL